MVHTRGGETVGLETVVPRLCLHCPDCFVKVRQSFTALLGSCWESEHCRTEALTGSTIRLGQLATVFVLYSNCSHERMKRALISLGLSLGVAILARPVCAAPKWVAIPSNDSEVTQIDLSSVRLVEGAALLTREESLTPCPARTLVDEDLSITCLDTRALIGSDRGLYQYHYKYTKKAGFLDQSKRHWRYYYGYQRISCSNKIISGLVRNSGPTSDGRMHEVLTWVHWTSPVDPVQSFVCQYAKKYAIPKLEQNWDLKPESYVDFADQ